MWQTYGKRKILGKKKCLKFYLKDKGIVTDEDMRCFVAWYMPEKGKEAEKQDDLCIIIATRH